MSLAVSAEPVIADIGQHVALGAAPAVAFTQLAPVARTAPPVPLFLLGPASPRVHEELFAQTRLAEIGTYALEDAVIAPSGIAIKDKVAFNSTAFIHPPHHVQAVATRLLAADLPTRRLRGTVAVIYGPGHQTYGHWLVDFLPRLWVLAESGHDLAKLRYVMPPELTPDSRRLLALLGIGRSQLVAHRYWREVLLADRLLMPTGLRAGNRIAPQFRDASAFWTRQLRAAAPAPDGQQAKLFVSRTQVIGARILSNREGIEAIAAQRGYAVVHPQRMTLGEQAALFAGARLIVGEYGSALHGSVHATPGTVVVGLRGTSQHPSFVQSGVSDALGQRMGYLLGATKLGYTEGDIGQVFTVQEEDFERALDIAELAAGVAA